MTHGNAFTAQLYPSRTKKTYSLPPVARKTDSPKASAQVNPLAFFQKSLSSALRGKQSSCFPPPLCLWFVPINLSTEGLNPIRKADEPNNGETMPDRCDILILGAGAAGLMAAFRATIPKKEQPVPCVFAADANPIPGRKLCLAGGGMGNITNLDVSVRDYVGQDPNFAASCLRRFPPKAVLGLIADLGLAWEEREYGQIFGLQPASRFAKALAERAIRQGARFFMRYKALDVAKTPEGFLTRFDAEGQEVSIASRCLLLATGSPAWPACGATDAGLAFAARLGHKCAPFRPALTPLILPEGHPMRNLSGVSADVGLTLGGRRLIRSLLFTHAGLSGPAALVASCFWRAGEPLILDFLPNVSINELPDQPEWRRASLRPLLRHFLPNRLADILTEAALYALRTGKPQAGKKTIPADPPERLAQWNRAQRDILGDTVHRYALFPEKTAGMAKAEVASGGVLTRGANPRTMESLIAPGLYLAGELLDITGLLGGFNLHWALASGAAAGDAMRRYCRSS